ncbi:MAG: hypothetical protein IJB75_04500 [Oscillospiraceae bacterium]|nr:hypothetical protein [Oscillospiraceae bacterium]
MPGVNKPELPENEGYIPASPVKRTMAWVGIVYMVILVALTTYMYFAGAALTGIAPLLAIPGLVGLGAVALISHRTTGSPSLRGAWTLAILCWLVAIWFLFPGIAGLLANFT